MFNAKVYTVSIPSSGVALEEDIAREVIELELDEDDRQRFEKSFSEVEKTLKLLK